MKSRVRSGSLQTQEKQPPGTWTNFRLLSYYTKALGQLEKWGQKTGLPSQDVERKVAGSIPERAVCFSPILSCDNDCFNTICIFWWLLCTLIICMKWQFIVIVWQLYFHFRIKASWQYLNKDLVHSSELLCTLVLIIAVKISSSSSFLLEVVSKSLVDSLLLTPEIGTSILLKLNVF